MAEIQVRGTWEEEAWIDESMKCTDCYQPLAAPPIKKARGCNHILHKACTQCHDCHGNVGWQGYLFLLVGYPWFKRGEYDDSIYISLTPLFMAPYILLQGLENTDYQLVHSFAKFLREMKDPVFLAGFIFLYHRFVPSTILLFTSAFVVMKYINSIWTFMGGVAMLILSLERVEEAGWFWMIMVAVRMNPRPSLTISGVIGYLYNFIMTLLSLGALFYVAREFNLDRYLICMSALWATFRKSSTPHEKHHAEMAQVVQGLTLMMLIVTNNVRKCVPEAGGLSAR